jgi:hypothetical protein
VIERLVRSRVFASLSERGLMIFGALLVIGFVVRVAFAFGTYGVVYDMDSLRITAHALGPGGPGVYEGVRWPYPGGFLPLLAFAKWFSGAAGLDFDGVVQLPSILADLGIAWLVLIALRWQGASENRALAGAALVALGPSFIAISGYHGQVDSVAALPALAAAMVWIRKVPRRALYSGLLVGLAASVKQPLVFTALALMPTSHSWRERGTVLAGAVTIPVVSLLPFLITSWHDTIDRMQQNSGVPGFGGLSAFVQPSLARYWGRFEGPRPEIDSAILRLVDAQRMIVAVVAVAAMLLLWRRHVPALHAAAFIWLAALVANPNFAFQYLIWGLPFFLAAGYLERTALLQAAILPATLWLYWRPGLTADGWTYLIAIQVVWVGMAAVLASETVKLRRGGGRPRAPRPVGAARQRA